jgi:hypothetical protein
MKSQYEKTLLMSKLLNLHLGRSIERHTDVSKYAEMADRMKRIKASHVARLEALAERMDSHESNSDQIFRTYEGELEAQERGMQEMERDMRDLKNSQEGGETGDTVTKFPGAVDPAAKILGTG